MSQDTPKERAVSNGKGPAFPTENSVDGFLRLTGGMTKRELIAKDMMAACISAENSPAPDWDKCASDAVKSTNALLEALNAQ